MIDEVFSLSLLLFLVSVRDETYAHVSNNNYQNANVENVDGMYGMVIILTGDDRPPPSLSLSLVACSLQLVSRVSSINFFSVRLIVILERNNS